MQNSIHFILILLFYSPLVVMGSILMVLEGTLLLLLLLALALDVGVAAAISVAAAKFVLPPLSELLLTVEVDVMELLVVVVVVMVELAATEELGKTPTKSPRSSENRRDGEKLLRL